MEARRLNKDDKCIAELKALYERAFPANERHPFEAVYEDKSGAIEFYAFYEAEKFLGFAVLLNALDISHIVYFAIEEELRGRGYGGKALDMLHSIKRGRRVIVDIERDEPEAVNREQRVRRKEFYLRHGYSESEVKYLWRGEDYEILVYGGKLSGEDFEAFWENLKFVI